MTGDHDETSSRVLQNRRRKFGVVVLRNLRLDLSEMYAAAPMSLAEEIKRLGGLNPNEKQFSKQCDAITRFWQREINKRIDAKQEDLSDAALKQRETDEEGNYNAGDAEDEIGSRGK